MNYSVRFVHPGDKSDIAAQLRMAAQCCQLTQTLLSLGDSLWEVPPHLLSQARQMRKPGQVRYSNISTIQIYTMYIYVMEYYIFSRIKDSWSERRR